MTQARSPAPRSLEEDISKWIDVENLCPEIEEETEDTFGNTRATQPSPSSLLPDPAGSDDRPLHPEASLLQFQTDTANKRKRHPSETLPPDPQLQNDFTVICFPSDPARPEGKKKKRKDFSQKRRLEVAQVRKEGACLRCKIRRISCGQGQPCKACLKTGGDLGPQICSREKLTKIRFATMDINYIEVTTRLLDQELVAGTTHVSPPRRIQVSLDQTDTPKLETEVQDYYTCDAAGWQCCWTVMNPINGGLDLFREESSRYALTRLPSTDVLIQWAEDITTYNEKRLVGLHQAMDSFILKYAKSDHDLPMNRLVQKVHQLNCLAKIRLGLVLCQDQDGDSMPPSCTLHTQFCLISKTASQHLEKEILSELEKVVFGGSGIGPPNGVALWASLWCLILMYRKLVRSYVAFRRFPCHVPKEYSDFPKTKLQMGTNFYHYMVSIYAALFRTTTPLYTDFRVKANRDLLRNDEDLIQAFMNVRTESFYFQHESTRMESPEDQLLRSLVVEREARLKPQIQVKR